MVVRLVNTLQWVPCSSADVESRSSTIGHITHDTKLAGKRSAGKPPATFDEAGTGNVERSRYSGTRRRKGEQQ